MEAEMLKVNPNFKAVEKYKAEATVEEPAEK